MTGSVVSRTTRHATSTATHSILQITISTGQLADTFITERQPRALALSPGGDRLFVGTVQGALGQAGLGMQVQAGSGFTDPYDGGSILIHDTSNQTEPTRIAVGSPVRGLAVLSDAVYDSAGSGQYRIYFTHVGEGVQSEDPEHGGQSIPNVISSVLMDSDHEPLERQDAIFHHRSDHEPADPVMAKGDLPAVIPERVVVRPESADEEFVAELWVTHSASGTLGRAWIVPETGAIATSGTEPLLFDVVDSLQSGTFRYFLGTKTIAYGKIFPWDLIRTDDDSLSTSRFRSRPRGLAIDTTTGLVVVATEFRSDLVFFDPDVHPFAKITPDSVVSIGGPISQYGRESLGEGNFFTFGEGFDFREVVPPNAAPVNNISCGTCHVDGHIDGKVRLTLRKNDNAPGEDKRMVTAVPSLFDAQQTEWIFFEGLVTVADREVTCTYCSVNKFFENTPNFNPGTPSSPYAGATTSLSSAAERGRAWFDHLNCSRCHAPQTAEFLRIRDPQVPDRTGPIATGPMLSDLRQVFISLPLAGDLSSLRNMSVVGSRASGSNVNPSSGALVLGINTPALSGVWDHRPYMHDGRYRTLDAALRSTWVFSDLGQRATRLWTGAGVPDNLFDREEPVLGLENLPGITLFDNQLVLEDVGTLAPKNFQTHAHESPGTGALSVHSYLSEWVSDPDAYDDFLAFLRELSNELVPYPDISPPSIDNLAIEPGTADEILLQWDTPQLTVCRVHGISAASSATIDTLSLGTSHSVALTLADLGPWTFTVETAYRGSVASASVGHPMFVNRSADTGFNYSPTPYSAIALDYDDDGRMDLLLSSVNDAAGLMENQESTVTPEVPEFQNRALNEFGQLTVPVNARGIAIADFDNDGDLDLLLTSRTSPALYEHDTSAQNRFTDISSSVMYGGIFTSVADSSWAAAWGDYDRDGHVDLYIGRAGGTTSASGGLRDVLLRNLGDGTFIEVTASVGLSAAPHLTTTGVVWIDADEDGELDLVVAGAGSSEELLLLRQSIDVTPEYEYEHSFESDQDLILEGVTALEGMRGVSVRDLDNDGHLDLVAVCSSTGSAGSRILWGSGSLGFDAETLLGEGVAASGVSLADLLLDGATDVLFAPSGAVQYPHVFLNARDGSPPTFHERGGFLGLGTSTPSSFQALAAADFAGPGGDPDGDVDLYLGRPSNSEAFFYQNARAGTDTPSRKWLKVTVASDDLPNNRAGIGSVVKVETSLPGSVELVQTQIVDGGSGVGTQAAHELVFGLANAVGDVEVEVTWPDGWVQQTIVSNGSLPTTVTMQENRTTVGLVAAAVGAYVQMDPLGDASWIFEWETSYLSDPSKDAVLVWGGKGACAISPVTLTPTSNDVTHKVFAMTDGGYLHRLAWDGRTCAIGCSYKYRVESAVSATADPDTSAHETLSISSCIN